MSRDITESAASSQIQDYQWIYQDIASSNPTYTLKDRDRDIKELQDLQKKWRQEKNDASETQRKLIILESFIKTLQETAPQDRKIVFTEIPTNQENEQEYWDAETEYEAFFVSIAEHSNQQEDLVQLSALRFSANIVEMLLFQAEEPLKALWQRLANPQNRKGVEAAVAANARNYWKMTQTQQEAQGVSIEAFQAQALQGLSEALTLQDTQEIPSHKQAFQEQYLASLLRILSVDESAVAQALQARQKNKAEPFTNTTDAATALLGKDALTWHQDMLTLEKEHHVVKGALASPAKNSPESQFVTAFLLKIGLDTPSRFIHYEKVASKIETQAAYRCAQILGETLNGNNNPQNALVFVEVFTRLSQTLGQPDLSQVDTNTPAYDVVLNAFINEGSGDQEERTAFFKNFFEKTITPLLQSAQAPHQKIFQYE